MIHLSEDPYIAVQGEGSMVGSPMTFVRLQGCEVGCVYCDSIYTWKKPDGTGTLPEDLYKKITDLGATTIWFTGGEPMMQSEGLSEIVSGLPEEYYKCICTAGTIFDRNVFEHIDWICVDVKAPSSGTQSDSKVIDKLTQRYTDKLEFKMVIGNNPEDKAFALETITKYGADFLWTLQPKYVNENDFKGNSIKMDWELAEFEKWIIDSFKQTDTVRMGLQLHKHIHPDKIKGV